MKIKPSRVLVDDQERARKFHSEVQGFEKPEEVFGIRIGQYADPTGLTISVSERNSAS